MKEIKTDFVVGGVARTDDYYFHKEFLEDLWDSLKKDNVLLLSPRRTGKTSVMYQMLDKPKYGYKVIHLNVEDLKTPAEFYISLIDAINEHQPEYLKKITSSWELLKSFGSKFEEVEFLDFKVKLRQSEDWEKNWQELSKQLIEKVIAADEPILFIIDELPDMISAMSEKSPELVKDFLHNFRKFRIDPKSHNNIRWLVGGSVNIQGTLNELGLSKQINDLKIETLPTIQANEVHNFVNDMLQEREVLYDKTLIPRMCELLGDPIAFFLQLFTQELFRYWRRHPQEKLTAAHADKVFRHSLLGEAAHDKLQHFHSRIKLHYPNKDINAAYSMLDKISLSDNGISDKALFSLYQSQQSEQTVKQNKRDIQMAFKNLMLRLKSDYYIDKVENDFYDFKSYLLKIWWRKNWGFDDE